MAAAAPIALFAMAAGQLYSGISQADQMRDNAGILKENARRTELTGALDELQVARDARAASGEAIAQQGGAGIELGTGSALEMLRQNAINAEFDKLNIRNQAAGEAGNLRSQAKQLKKQATATLIGSAISAGSSVLMGASMLGGGAAGAGAAGGASAAPGISAGAAYRMPVGSSPFGLGTLR
ncbi:MULTISPECIES: hypothetical protein [unclassified Sphingomonas]|uniref:hypothetical protein n=1 Tax=unclassified Sphingomonas TaxID=196159 RepID=UPI0007020E93|nr:MULTISPECIES: hypothetical protein [unclassified Sphingomonas]KQX19334.1 hypothetical protein ASD17_12385 [Sphingomonas sp. Root1294]KQY65537.1 hypothetical protein ASD39_15585 [Sphingomonas sp. Root50]KRB95163.1 hypothetical protein ASE22_04475 [Sphingomonas sp. Root720]